MKRIILSILLIVRFFSSYSYTIEQEADTAASNTSKKLTYSHYKKDFSPFDEGSWFTGLSFTLGKKDPQHVSRLLDQVEANHGLSYHLQVSGGHFLTDYFMIGIGFGFNESKYTGSLINRDSETINVQAISQNFNASPFSRVFMPLTENERLSFYNDFGLTFGYGRSVIHDMEKMDKKFSDQFSIGLGLSPGFTFFVMEKLALDAGVNLIGFRVIIDNSTDNKAENRVFEQDDNFKIDFLSPKIGISYFF